MNATLKQKKAFQYMVEQANQGKTPIGKKAGWNTGILNCNNHPKSFYISLSSPYWRQGGKDYCVAQFPKYCCDVIKYSI